MSNEMTNNNENNSAASTAYQTQAHEKFFTPAADIYDNRESLLIIMDLPGVSKDNTKIEIDENNVLSIRAKTSFTEPEGNVLREFESGSFYRAFSLSDEFNRDAINAKFQDGVLEITIPKKEEIKPRKIEISI